MGKDKIGDRFDKRRKAARLNELSRRSLSAEDIEAEEQAIAAAGKGQPIKADDTPNRNDPCPCGSGKKYKKCCGK